MLATRKTAFNCIGCPCASYTIIDDTIRIVSDYTYDGKSRVTTTYKYGADGLRMQKTVGSTVYNYYYADGRLVRQTWGSNYIDFLYDETVSLVRKFMERAKKL